VRVSSLYDSEDYLKNLSSTNLKNSPKPKVTPSKNTSEKFVTMNDLEDIKKGIEQTMDSKMDTIIQLFHNQNTITQEMEAEENVGTEAEENSKT
jgi:hypothetical protein